MKKIILNFTLFGAATFLLLGCAALKSTNSTLDYIQASVDLVAINDDKVQVEITPPKIQSEEITFYIPQIVPGTYEYSNFGRFIENLQAYDSKGNLLDFEALDENSWKISNAKKLAKITYWANDTFDGPGGSEIYPMGGTNFQEGETFLLNLHSLIGYFEGMKETSYRLSVRSPKGERTLRR